MTIINPGRFGSVKKKGNVVTDFQEKMIIQILLLMVIICFES